MAFLFVSNIPNAVMRYMTSPDSQNNTNKEEKYSIAELLLYALIPWAIVLSGNSE